MNTDTNIVPLWKELNEKRTQGKAMLYRKVLPNNHLQIGVTVTDKNGATHTILLSTNYSTLDINSKDEWTKKAEANAKYTALAVNNFASVVEALERLKNDFEKYFAAILKKEPNVFKSLNEAKQVLTNIK